MKKIVATVLFLCLLCGLGTTAHAENSEKTDAYSALKIVSSSVLHESMKGAFRLCDQPEVPDRISDPEPPPKPIYVRMEMVGSVPYITKTYEIPPGEDFVQLENMDNFEQDGYVFRQYDRYSQAEPDTTISRTQSIVKTVYVETDDLSLVLQQIEPSIQYDEDGFAGQLYLVGDSITIVPATGDGNDDKKDDVPDSGYLKTQTVPKGFNNITFDGVVHESGNEAEGFVATVQYEGIVEKLVPGITYTHIVFRGESDSVTGPINRISLLTICACLMSLLAVIGFAAVAVVTSGKARKRQKRDAQVSTRDIYVEKIREVAEQSYDENLIEPLQDELLDETDILPEDFAIPEVEDETDYEDDQDDCAGDGYFYGQYTDEERI